MAHADLACDSLCQPAARVTPPAPVFAPIYYAFSPRFLIYKMFCRSGFEEQSTPALPAQFNLPVTCRSGFGSPHIPVPLRLCQRQHTMTPAHVRCRPAPAWRANEKSRRFCPAFFTYYKAASMASCAPQSRTTKVHRKSATRKGAQQPQELQLVFQGGVVSVEKVVDHFDRAFPESDCCAVYAS